LRERALDRAADGFRHGLAVLLTKGVAAWIHAAGQLTPTPAQAHAARERGVSVGDRQERELVSLLAAMALACVAE
jgi:kynureninase